jgi:hypothetical protein
LIFPCSVNEFFNKNYFENLSFLLKKS